MPDRIRISRRRVMQMGILAPLLAMEARGASPAELETAAVGLVKTPIPPGKLKEFKDKAKQHCKENNCDGFDENQYGLIASVLWAYFTDAVERGGAKIPTVSAELAALLDAAYKADSGKGKSGELVASRTKDWGDIWEHVTNYCAYRCGLHAAAIAKGNTITPDNYSVAYGKTSAEIETLTAKIKRNGRDEVIKGGGC